MNTIIWYLLNFAEVWMALAALIGTLAWTWLHDEPIPDLTTQPLPEGEWHEIARATAAQMWGRK